MSTNARFRIVIGTIAITALVGAYAVFNRSESGGATQSTDDAYVQADFTVISPQISGVINRVLVEDNQQVHVGARLINIDDRDLRVALDTTNASIESLKGQLDRQQSAIAQARSAVDASSAHVKLAEANRSRFSNLARDGSGTILAQQQADVESEVQHAALERDQAALRSSIQQVSILQAELKKAYAAKADVELKLSYANITAPVSGVVTQRRARVGSYVQTGEPLLTLVPLDALYIEANFRELQISRIQVGQSVDILVDALPGVRLRGKVESLGPASGVSFSTVTAHNATGNFTKIVQRLPVRIKLDPTQVDAHRLRVGMSVQPTIIVEANKAS